MAALSPLNGTSESTPLVSRRGSSHIGDEKITIQQAAVFIEDGIHYRSIHHKIDQVSLRLYRIYRSQPIQIILNVTVFVILSLAFVEYPSSLKLSSDFRFALSTPQLPEPPCGAIECIELVCLSILLINWIIQFQLIGLRRFVRQPWLILYAVMVIYSFIDIAISVGFCFGIGQSSLGATLRLRRFFRPFFFLVPSSIMKKFIKAVGHTVVQIFSVLVLLALHIYVFAMIGMLIFPKIIRIHSHNSTLPFEQGDNVTNVLLHGEATKYFGTVEDSLVSLLVFLTTANNPDVMTTIYQYNRLVFIYFFAFLSIGLYLILNLLTAAVYSEFRGFMEQSMQSSFVRRRVAYRAAFAVLSRRTDGEYATKDQVRQLLQRARIPKHHLPAMYTLLETVNISSTDVTWEEFRNIFDVISKDSATQKEPDIEYYSRYKFLEYIQRLVRFNWFHYFTICMTVLHVGILTVEMEVDYSKVNTHSDSPLAIVNFVFFFYYIMEQTIKLVGLGWKVYFKSFAHVFEGVVTLAILITEIILLCVGQFFNDSNEGETYSLLIRIMNLFIVFRLLRIIPQFRSVSFVFGTMIEILKNLRAFSGIIVVIYYLFALLGMELFGENYKLENLNSSRVHTCGLYENSLYYSYNFHDFASSLVILWNIMVVNNWYVFLEAFSFAATKWSQLYFIAWWLIAVIITVNLFVSLVIDVFLTRWEVYQANKKRLTTATTSNRDSFGTESFTSSGATVANDIRMILHKNLVEPDESHLQHEIHKHQELM
jgi:two pore calcium channel protein 2